MYCNTTYEPKVLHCRHITVYKVLHCTNVPSHLVGSQKVNQHYCSTTYYVERLISVQVLAMVRTLLYRLPRENGTTENSFLWSLGQLMVSIVRYVLRMYIMYLICTSATSSSLLLHYIDWVCSYVQCTAYSIIQSKSVCVFYKPSL